MYFAYINSMNKLIGMGVSLMQTDDYGSADVKNIEISENIYNAYIEDNDRFIYQDGEIVANPDYEEIKQQKHRQELDALTLTPADVERALLKAKGMDFEDLKTFLKNKGYTDLQIKAIGVELRASDFFRGATLNGIRIVDAIGGLLGYTTDDMDYLFIHKELPSETPEVIT